MTVTSGVGDVVLAFASDAIDGRPVWEIGSVRADWASGMRGAAAKASATPRAVSIDRLCRDMSVGSDEPSVLCGRPARQRTPAV